MTTNPIHIYRALLRECTYLPLPQCRSSIKSYVTTSFRRWMPKYNVPRTNTGREIDFSKQVHLLRRGRKFLSTLQRANEGYTAPLEKVLRMTYGRIGPRRYTLLNKFTCPPAAADESKPSDSPLSSSSQESETVPPSSSSQEPSSRKVDPHDTTKYTPPPRLEALLTSQAGQQHTFERAGRRIPKVRLRFSPSATNIWGDPLPRCRYKNLKHGWYNSNLKAALPPLPEPEYKQLQDLVTGAIKMPDTIPRRPKASQSKDDKQQDSLVADSSLVLTGPQPGPRMKDFRNGRPHNITPRLLRHLLARSVLKQSPLAKATEVEKSKAGLVFDWDDGHTVARVQEQKLVTPTNDTQSRLLFG